MQAEQAFARFALRKLNIIKFVLFSCAHLNLIFIFCESSDANFVSIQARISINFAQTFNGKIDV